MGRPIQLESPAAVHVTSAESLLPARPVTTRGLRVHYNQLSAHTTVGSGAAALAANDPVPCATRRRRVQGAWASAFPICTSPLHVGLQILCIVLLVLDSAASAGDTFPTNEVPGDLLIDIGTMEQKKDQGYGWSLAESAEGRNYRWMKSVEAQRWIDVEKPGDATLWVEASPLYLPYTRQVLAVYLNRRFVGEWVCADQSGFAPYHMEVPSRFLKQGRNELILRAAYRQSVGPDARKLSVCIDKLLFRFH